MPKAFCGLETCAKKLSELCVLWERKTYPHTPTMFYFSQNNTDEQNTQSFTETLSQPISQNLTAVFGSNVLWILYAGGVLWVRNVGGKVLLNLWVLWEKNLYKVCKQAYRGNLTYHSPLHSERGWGWGLCELCMPEAFCEFETVRKKVLLNLWVLWEKKIPSKSHRHYLIEWVRSISHRITQMNRTHKVSQRH